MIQDISSYEDCREFISGFQGDPLFSDPMLSTQEMLDCNLIKAFTRPNRRILGVYDAQLAGHTMFMSCRNIAVEAMGESCWPRRWNAISPRG